MAMLPLRGVSDPRAVADSVAALGEKGAAFVDLKAESDHLLQTYQREAVSLALIGGIVVLVLLAASLRSWRRVLAVAAPLAAAVVITAALLTAGGQKLSIFNLVGLLLIVAVGSNYCLFFERLSGDDAQRERSVASLVLANLCTVIGFGLLSFSGIPVLHDIGLTVAAGTLACLFLSAVLSTGRSAEAGGTSFGPAAMTPADPMRLVHHRAPDPRPDRTLLVMLPGVGIEPEDFAAHGFVAAAQASGLPVDIAVARPDLDLYLEGTIADAIESAIVAPARQVGYRRIWLLGISLGGMGALLYAGSPLASVDGIILLAPFLGTPGIIAEIGRAGGLHAWQPGEIAAKDGERALLAWLKSYIATLPPRPMLYLGYARGDRFVAGHVLLAGHLPAGRVVVAEGGHDWETWGKLWQLVLDKRPFAGPEG